MAKTASEQGDPLERAIEVALQLGRFVSYDAASAFVSDLKEEAGNIERLVPAAAARAARLYEIFISGCTEKADEIDDSLGHLGTFVESLFCGWIKARVAAGADREETVDTLLDWMEKDEYGFCHGLEREAVKAFDKEGLSAFECQVRSRAAKGPSGEGPEAAYHRKRSGAILRAIYVEQGDVDAYVALCKETDCSPQDCLAVARMHNARHEPSQALSWIEQGIALDRKRSDGSMADHDLAKLKRELLMTLGRSEEALAEAWEGFKAYPSSFSYEELMNFVPKEDRAAWHDNAMEAAEEADLGSALELWLEAGDVDRIVGRLRKLADKDFDGLSHYRTHDVAELLSESHPDLAARIYRAMGMSILVRKKSKAYEAALSHFEKAQGCYVRAGLVQVWEALVAHIRAEHRRKLGFMGGFEKLLAGRGPSKAPTFLERARSRWVKRGRS